MLPSLDGFSITERLRLNNNQTPILILSAKNTSANRVQGLKLGADDYLTKPFNLEELLNLGENANIEFKSINEILFVIQSLICIVVIVSKLSFSGTLIIA